MTHITFNNRRLCEFPVSGSSHTNANQSRPEEATVSVTVAAFLNG